MLGIRPKRNARPPLLDRCPLASRDSYYPDAQLKFFLRGMKAAGKPVELPPSMHTFPRAHDILAAVLAES
eukprot:scaffold226847_cov36-Tisochrysis_lutea.AAC.1